VGSNDYDAFAEAYAEDNETNAWNAFYERPAVLAMTGDVAGRRAGGWSPPPTTRSWTIRRTAR
jgi:hypothetical protein